MKQARHLKNGPKFMRLALKLAKRGCGATSPNPMVGAVLVKGGKFIGLGTGGRFAAVRRETVRTGVV